MKPKPKKNQPPLSRHYDLAQRTLVNGVSAIIIAMVIFLAESKSFKWIFPTAIASIAGIALWEYYQILKKKGLLPSVVWGVVSIVVYVFAVFFKTQLRIDGDGFWGVFPAVVLGVSLLGCFAFFATGEKRSIESIATTFFGLIYIGIPLSLLLVIVYFFSYRGISAPFFQGSWWVIYLIATTKSADIGGYFAGRYFGKRKIAVKLSPNKTLEGSIGGLFVSIAVSLLICALGKNIGGVFSSFSYLHALWLGALIGFLGQLGDLAESLLKRDAGVKDSNTLPGVGGILDMVDSLLFTTPVMYIFLRILYATSK